MKCSFCDEEAFFGIAIQWEFIGDLPDGATTPPPRYAETVMCLGHVKNFDEIVREWSATDGLGPRKH